VRIYCQLRHLSDGRARLRLPLTRKPAYQADWGLDTHVRRQVDLHQLLELGGKIGQVRKIKSDIPTALSIELAVGIRGMRRSTAEPGIHANIAQKFRASCPNR